MAQGGSAQQALGIAVRRLRRDRGLSQEQLALESGLDRTYVGGVERGERNPTLESLRKLATGLGMRPSQVLSQAERLKEWPQDAG